MPKEWPAPELLGPAVTIAKGHTIARAGSGVKVLHLIDSGIVGRFVSNGDHEVLDAVRSKGWLLGAVSAMTSGSYEATIRALTACEVRPITLGAFRRAAETLAVSTWLNGMFAADMFAQTARNGAVAKRSARSLVEELFVELMQIAGRRHEDGSVRLTLDLSVVDVAQMIGVSREHATRVLADLESNGWLIKSRGWFVAPVGSLLLSRLRSLP